MTKLSSLGFAKGVNCEAIVTTLNPDGSPNAAPMGMHMKDEQHLALNVYNSAQTCQNLKATRCAAVNLTNSIEVYFRSTFKEANQNGKISPAWFVKSEVVEAPRLRDADAVIEVAVSSVSAGEERTVFNCKVEAVLARKQLPQAYCRALPLAIEAVTHATRIKAFMHDPTKQAQVTELIDLIGSHGKIVERVAPNSEFTAVFQELDKLIETWRAQP